MRTSQETIEAALGKMGDDVRLGPAPLVAATVSIESIASDAEKPAGLLTHALFTAASFPLSSPKKPFREVRPHDYLPSVLIDVLNPSVE